jgi:hypothetical protein
MAKGPPDHTSFRVATPRPPEEVDERVSADYAERVNRELAEAEEELLRDGGIPIEEYERRMGGFMAELRARSKSAGSKR